MLDTLGGWVTPRAPSLRQPLSDVAVLATGPPFFKAAMAVISPAVRHKGQEMGLKGEGADPEHPRHPSQQHSASYLPSHPEVYPLRQVLLPSSFS